MGLRQTLRVALRAYGPFESAIQKQWESFRGASGCALRLEAVPFDFHQLYEHLFEKEELKRGDWDIAFVNTDWLAAVHETGAALDLAPFIEWNPPPDYPAGWSPSLLRMQCFGDQVVGMPYHDGPECLIYRRDLFENPREQAAHESQFGEPLQLPRTWREFHRIARFFTRPQQKLYGTVFAALPDGHNTVYDYCLQLWARGGELFDSADHLLINSPPSVAALEFYRTILNDASACHPDSRAMDSVKSGLAFARGEVATMVNWFGFASMAETASDSRVRGRVDIAELPHEEPASSASLNVYWVLAIGRGSPYAQAAYNFLRHCLTPPMDKLLTLGGAIGCRLSTWNDSQVNEAIPFHHRLRDLHTHARELPRRADWPSLASLIDDLVLRTINSGQPVREVAQEVQRKADALATAAGAHGVL